MKKEISMLKNSTAEKSMFNNNTGGCLQPNTGHEDRGTQGVTFKLV